ncbi:DNA alkylation repair protein [Winogradskyella sp.]|uniref:DNA alkylation repair protein n=1 Tax=Winogradskyella sp. TaxID=1883156 RepID=UPI002615D4CA|nr:DNA alkylation repair protein [Winogradskyella sp.]
MQELVQRIKKIEHGFKHIIEAGSLILKDKTQNHFDLANSFLTDETYQVRMLAVYLLGQLSTENTDALHILETEVGKDENWRVQEMLAKAFDHYCKTLGYENSLPKIKKWLSDKNPNIKRAVTEGLRIWTSRPYFKENPQIAITLISANRDDESEYLRRSVGNSLRDIRKKHKELVDKEISNWGNSKRVEFVKKIVTK